MLFSFLIALTTLAPGDRWPGFLGQGDRASDLASIPLEWSPEKNLAWSVETPGYGQSSPVIWDGVIYLTSVEGPNKERYHLSAVDLASGKTSWRHTFENAEPMKSSVYVSRAAPTPCVDADGVYAFYESGQFVATRHDGEVRWERDLGEEYGRYKNRFCIGASPTQNASHVFVLADHEGPSYLLALDKESGMDAWKTERSSRTSWASPILMEIAGVEQVVASSGGTVDGYDAKTGALLWSMEGLGGNTSNTPVPFGEGRFLCGASPGQRGEHASTSPKTNIAVEVTRNADGEWTPEVLWTAERATSSFGSPIVHAGHAYYVNGAGIVTCFDAASGEKKYSERMENSIWATPLGVDDRVYFFGKDGLTTVLAAGAKHDQLALNELWSEDEAKPDEDAGADENTAERRSAAAGFSGPIQYGYAVAEGRLVLRTGPKLFCLQRQDQ